MSSSANSSGGGGSGGHDKKRMITIDPNLQLSMSSKKTARRGARSRSNSSGETASIKPRPFIRPNTLKKTLLDKIKRHQQRQMQRGNSATPKNPFSTFCA